MASHQYDLRAVSRRIDETRVSGEERGVEGFGQSHVGGVIGREIVPQFPDTGNEEIVWIPAQRQIQKVGESRATAFAVDLTARDIPANHLGDFDVEQMGRV